MSETASFEDLGNGANGKINVTRSVRQCLIWFNAKVLLKAKKKKKIKIFRAQERKSGVWLQKLARHFFVFWHASLKSVSARLFNASPEG